MRRILFLCVFCITLLLLTSTANIAMTQEISVLINGTNADLQDQQSYIDENNRTMVPIRLAEKLGALVEWDGVNKKISIVKGEKRVLFTIDDKKAKVNGATLEMDTVAVLTVAGRTMIPLRFMVEALNLDISWESSIRTVSIKEKDIPEKITKSQIEIWTDVDPVNLCVENNYGGVYYISVNNIGTEIYSFKSSFLDKDRNVIHETVTVQKSLLERTFKGRTYLKNEVFTIRLGCRHPEAQYLAVEVKAIDDNNNEIVSTKELMLTYDNYSDLANFLVPKELGDPRLTKAELLYIAKDPKRVQEKIDNVYDLIRYMHVNQYVFDNQPRADGSHDIRIQEGSYIWHHNESAEQAIISNKGICGSTANFAHYILKNDYEETGIIQISFGPTEGGHYINYIRHQGKYYIIDFSSFPTRSYAAQGIIYTVDDLSEYSNLCKSERKGLTVTIIVSYKTDSVLPIAHMGNSGLIYLPQGFEVNTIYNLPEYAPIFIPGPTKLPE